MQSEHLEPLDDLEAPPARPSMMGRLLLFALMAAAAAVCWQYIGPRTALAGGGWIHDWDAAIAQARSSGKPALVLFTADWCPACRQLESQTLVDPAVRKHLRENFTLVVVDLSDRGGPNAQRAQEFRVSSIPTLILYDQSNLEVARTNGLGPTALVAWLDSGGG